MIDQVQFILYCKDQKRSRDFYCEILAKEPILDVPGMTEFLLTENTKLGLMPESGIAKILNNKTPHPSLGSCIPRCELYLITDDLEIIFGRAIDAGAIIISKIALRDWGDTVGYLMDFDGNIIALAQKTIK
ncbi:MAG: lactoylglutathione lyase [Bacteroidetes bacterium]|nr:lactoylglutathione lyase [Bacteroidota bacterium]